MLASPRASRIFTGAAKAVETHGDAIWCALCDAFLCDVPFTLDEAVAKLRAEPEFACYKSSTLRQYIRATVTSVIDEGNDQIRKNGGWWYVLPSA